MTPAAMPLKPEEPLHTGEEDEATEFQVCNAIAVGPALDPTASALSVVDFHSKVSPGPYTAIHEQTCVFT